MTWTYDPEDIPERKHRDALRGELPPGAMLPEPISEAERRDRYAHGDPALRHYLEQTDAQQDALRRHDFDTKKEMLDSFQRGQGRAPEPLRPGDHLINPIPSDLSLMDDGEEHEEDDKPFYRVWHESGDYLGGSSDPHRAGQIMGGHILNHLADTRDEGEECRGCGDSPAEHGFHIQPVNGAEDNWGDDLSPRYSRVAGSVSRASDTIWR